ncbi:MAG: hypothetical protein ISS53_03455 [Dehalococcoidia bacterium]|nr:hypothetical protein [Dehalococcoidia bacterium]
MKIGRFVVCLAVSVFLMLALVSPVAAQVEPPEVIADMAPGESMTVVKTVQTPLIPPLPDIYFMSDTTGSMGDVIETVGDNADAILAVIALADPTAQFGVGNYKDFPYDGYAFQNQLGITDDTAAVSAALQSWTAGGGYDGPEGQFYALTNIATDPDIGWREGATRIVVWFGDAPAHDPVPAAATGLGYDITEDTVTQALVDAGIRVVAISTPTWYYEDALDDDPLDAGGDYATAYGIVEDGIPGQASRITDATGGVHLTNVLPEDVVDAILEGLTNLPVTVTPVCEGEGCEYLEVTFDPPSQTVTSGEVATFVETITVSLDAPECQKECMVYFYIDDNPEPIAEQYISIHVLPDVTPPEVWCVESVNPHGKKIPPAGSTTMPGPKGGRNDDGFYQVFVEDNCDEAPMVWIGTEGEPRLFEASVDFVFHSGMVIKFTEARGAAPSIKKMGSDKGQAGAVEYHITLPSDLLVTAVDYSGNMATCLCLVPPPPK